VRRIKVYTHDVESPLARRWDARRWSRAKAAISRRYPIEASDDQPHQLSGAHRMFFDFCCTSASPSTRRRAKQTPTKELRTFPHRYTRLDVAPLREFCDSLLHQECGNWQNTPRSVRLIRHPKNRYVIATGQIPYEPSRRAATARRPEDVQTGGARSRIPKIDRPHGAGQASVARPHAGSPGSAAQSASRGIVGEWVSDSHPIIFRALKCQETLGLLRGGIFECPCLRSIPHFPTGRIISATKTFPAPQLSFELE
jgi:hypothetical protein